MAGTFDIVLGGNTRQERDSSSRKDWTARNSSIRFFSMITVWVASPSAT